MLTLSKSTKAKVINVVPMAIKKGQKDTLPALSLRLEVTLANHELIQLAAGLREFLFTKPSTDPQAVKARQEPLEGVEPVSDLPSLSIAAQRLGTFEWNHEQTGCTLVIDRGTGGKKSNIPLEGCTFKKLQLTPQEGGSFKARFTLNSSPTDDEDDETYGRLAKLKKRDIYVTLTPPKVDDTQPTLDQGSTMTPIKALASGKDVNTAESALTH